MTYVIRYVENTGSLPHRREPYKDTRVYRATRAIENSVIQGRRFMKIGSVAIDFFSHFTMDTCYHSSLTESERLFYKKKTTQTHAPVFAMC